MVNVLTKKQLSLQEYLTSRKIEFKEEYLQKDCLVVTNSTITVEDVMFIKQIRQKTEVTILNLENKSYQDFRGGEYEIATFVVSAFLIPLVVTLLGSFIQSKIQSYKKTKEETGNDKLKIPRFSAKLFNLTKKELIELEGEAEDVLKALKELRDDSENSS